jgi:DNA polymerase III alpha subunit
VNDTDLFGRECAYYIDLYDKHVYARFIPPFMQNEGVFQFKTNTAASILSKIRVKESFVSPFDAAIITAAGRPGPMKSGLVKLR